MAEVRDGNEPLLLGFGAVWVLPNIRCLVQFEFFASAEIWVLFRFSYVFFVLSSVWCYRGLDV